jgi:hypothetical protein
MTVQLLPISEFVRLLHSYGFLSLTSANDKERRYFLLIDAYHEFLIAYQYFEGTDGVGLLDTACEMFNDAGFPCTFALHITFEKWYEEFQSIHDALIAFVKKGYGNQS